jgi:hypothetical protein
VIQRGILGQYRRARGFLYPLVPSQQTTELDDDLGTADNSDLVWQQLDKQDEEGFYSPEGFPSFM